MTDGGSDGMPSLLMQAARSAAQADGLLPGGGSHSNNNNSQQQQQQQQQQALAQARLAVQNARAMQMQQQQQQQSGFAANSANAGKKKGPPLRRGKWTPEEEAYANRLIQEFKAGLLPLTDGTTLRTFLSKLLNCDPMRISKKFVGSNCIGKQVFRRRTADLNRLTPDQIAQSRAELSELERRFLERVAQTNRVKSSGVGGGGGGGNAANTTGGSSMVSSSFPVGKNALDNLAHQHQQQHQQQQQRQMQQFDPPSPPWLQPPADYKHGEGAALAAASSRSAAAGRALLGGFGGSSSSSHRDGGFGSGSSNASSDLLAELQRRASNQSMLNAFQQQQQQQQSSTSNLLAAAAARSGSANGLGGNSSLSLSQFSRNLSASRLAGLGGNSSMNELMLKTGLSRDQLSSLARERNGLSSGSLSNMIQRQNSFDALMSLDFQSIQSIDNLANLIQSGGGGGNVPESGIRNADFGTSQMSGTSSGDLSQAARRLASQGRMESLLRNLSSHNMRDGFGGGGSGRGGVSNANLSNLLQSMQNMQNAGGSSSTNAGATNASMASLLGGGNGSSVGLGGGNQNNSVSLADLLRQDSSTGLSALRMQDGLTQRNSSVDDFLSLVAAGDIPHQDPSLLNVPLMQQQQSPGDSAAAKYLSSQGSSFQQSNPALANALASRSFGNLGGSGDGGSSNFSSDMLQQFAQQQMSSSSSGNKRKFDDLGMLSALGQGDYKR